MKAAWICRACSRRLQASQTPRPSLQFSAAQRANPSRRYTSEATVASDEPCDDGPRSAASSAKTSRFAEAPSGSQASELAQETHEKETRQPASDPFQAAFEARRGHDSKNATSSKNQTSILSSWKPRQLPTIPEDLSTLYIPYSLWKNKLNEIQADSKSAGLRMEKYAWLDDLKSGDIAKLWPGMTTRQRTLLWRPFILAIFFKDPEAVPGILVSTLAKSLRSPSEMQNVLHAVSRSLNRTTVGYKKRRTMLRDVHRVMMHYVKKSDPSQLSLRQSTLGLYAKFFTRDQVSELYRATKGTELKKDTLLHFASTLGGLRASDQHREEAFEILQGLVGRGQDLMNPAVASVITSLLHQKFMDEKSSFAPLQHLQYFMENGFLPNVITLTALIETLCERNEFNEAMHIVKLFSASGLKLDIKGYDTLLKGARHTDTEGQFGEALQYCKDAGAPQSLLAKHGLHAIYSHIQSEVRASASLRPGHLSLYDDTPQQQHALAQRPQLTQESQEAFNAMLRFYAKRFELNSLQSVVPQVLPYLVWNEEESTESLSKEYKATLMPTLEEIIPIPANSTMTPCAEILSLMLRAYIKGLWRPYDLMSMYSFFKGRLGDPTGEGSALCKIVKARGTFLHDSFILAMMQTHALVRPALEVFGDMLKDNFRDSATGIHPPPSVHTFGMILAGLSRHKENRLFDSFKQIMEENGLTPNLVTTNILVKNYSSRQEVGMAVAALRDLETLGFRPDKFTFDGFGRLLDQEQALDLMSKIIDENKKRSLGQTVGA